MFESNKLIGRFGCIEKSQGFLQLDNAKEFIYPYGYSKGATAPVTVDGNDYYIKEVNGNKLSAELLLGPIFNKLGITCAIYLPVRHGDYSEAISNDVLNENSLITSVYLSKLKNTIGKVNPFIFGEDKSFEPLTMPREQLVVTHAIKQNLKMNAVDLALGNWDRGYGNFGVKMQDDKVTDIVLYDNEASGWRIDYKKYHNNFSYLSLTEEQIMQHYRQNEEYRQYITPQELSQTVGSIEIDKTAQAVTESTGHQFDQDYIDFLKFRVDRVAEELEHC